MYIYMYMYMHVGIYESSNVVHSIDVKVGIHYHAEDRKICCRIYRLHVTYCILSRESWYRIRALLACCCTISKH